MSFFSKFKKEEKMVFSGPVGQRAYVIGDIHGCFDVLRKLLDKIEEHNNLQKKADVKIIYLGDLIDRGPQSREVVDYLSSNTPIFAESIFLMGNHEEVFLQILNGDADAMQSWFSFGGRACARSYGLENLGQVNIDPVPLLFQLQGKVPKSHIDFITKFEKYYLFGDFLCVHAGIKPKIRLEEQRSQDLRWIRSSFLNYTKLHANMVVHGHTIIDEPTKYNNRIAIDTGAYNGGLLSALCIDGVSTSFLSVKNEN